MLKLKNIIFDLGNVILNIDTKLSEIEFAKHGLNNFSNLYSLASQSKIFDRLEVGAMSPKAFYQEFRELTSSNLSDQDIKDCWNALIQDYPKSRIDLLESLKTRFKTFILSNTNEIHYEYYTKLLKDNYGYNGLESLVEKAYFSHKIKMKKPGLEVFNYVLKDSNLNPSESLFIDDNYDNIKAANSLNFQTIHLDNLNLEDLEIWSKLDL